MFAIILTILATVVSYIIYKAIKYRFFVFILRKFCGIKKNIKGQNVLITGAGSGVGRALAIEFSKHAVSLILIGRTRETLLETEQLLDPSSRAFLYDFDVSDRKMMYTVAEKIKEDVGDVDILVNNAAIAPGKYLLDLDDDEIQQTMEINTLAHFWACKAFLPGMIKKNRGHIVSITSVAGKITGPKLSVYCASKFAAIGFAEALDVELRERRIDGIKVTIVCPSLINTPLFDGFKSAIAIPMTPEYVAREILDGVLKGKETIFMPRWTGYALLVKECAPRWMVIKYLELTGDINCMKTFKGSSTAEKAQVTSNS